jgi:riboflavin transporter
MYKASTLSSTISWQRLAKIGLLISLGLLIPAMGLPQAVTGPLVNVLLILAVESTGVGAAMVVGMVTPLNALLHGILPLPLAVMIPFIALGNAAFVGLYGALRQKNYWLGVIVGAVVKFALLYGTVTWLVARPISVAMGAAAAKAVTLPAAIIYQMQWPQLATALAGGVIAFGLLYGYNKLGKKA